MLRGRSISTSAGSVRVTNRWLLRGHGQETASYGPGKRPFKFRDLV